jgi:cyclophilin family peptidyl-prolyl cis-trans isomerase
MSDRKTLQPRRLKSLTFTRMARPVFIVASLLFSYCIVTSCAQNKDYVVTIKTKYGDMVAILYDETPKHKANFVKLAKEHYFDSLLFHRVIKDFMIQGGDPNSKRASQSEHLGTGGPGYTVEAEFNPKFLHEKGALSAARISDQQNPSKASSGSQFYIVHGKKFTESELKVDATLLNKGLQQILMIPGNEALFDTLSRLYQSGDMEAYEAKVMSLKPRIERETGLKVEKDIPQERLDVYTTIGGAPHLDGQYTVFGKVIKGLEVIDWIAEQPVDEAERPRDDIRMIVTVEELPKKKIEKLYGDIYPDFQ